MNVIEVGDKIIWPYRTACPLCSTVVELDPADINQKHHEPVSNGWWKCPRCGGTVPVHPVLSGAAKFEVDRLLAADEYSDNPALPPLEVQTGKQA